MTDPKQAALDAAKAEAEKVKPAATKPAVTAPKPISAAATAKVDTPPTPVVEKAPEPADNSRVPEAAKPDDLPPTPYPLDVPAPDVVAAVAATVTDVVALPPLDEAEPDGHPEETYEEWLARMGEREPLVTAPGGDYMDLPPPQETPHYTLGPRNPNDPTAHEAVITEKATIKK